MFRKRAKWPPHRLVAPDLPSCPSGPQANLAWPWPWREKEATAALSEARTVPPAMAHALSPEDKEILGDRPTGCLSGEASWAPEMPVLPPLVALLCLSPNPAEPR